MRAVGYFREPSASTIKAQGRQTESISQQNRRFLDYCEAQGYDVATTFSEESGSPGGPAFTQLIEYLKRPEKGFMIVVSPSPANLADDTVVAAARCLQVERLGAKLQFMDGENGADGDPLDSIVKSWSNSRSDEVREKVKSALRRKAVRGEVLGRPPYGYHVGPRNRLEVVDDEAVVVRYIFRLYLHEGLGIRLIARRLNQEGLQTRRNRPWSMVSIRDILRNRAYLGTYQRLGVRVPGTHPALASPDDFRRVQERLIDRRTNFSRLTGRSESQIALVEAYCKEQGMFHDPAGTATYSQVLELDLANVEPSLAGPRRPQDRIALSQAKSSFSETLPSFGVTASAPDEGRADSSPSRPRRPYLSRSTTTNSSSTTAPSSSLRSRAARTRRIRP